MKSSTGQEQMRYFIKGSIKVGSRNLKTEFSLTERKGMKYPILLGRKLLNKKLYESIEKELNNIEYNLFHLSEIQYNNFLNPYLRDRKINQLLS